MTLTGLMRFCTIRFNVVLRYMVASCILLNTRCDNFCSNKNKYVRELISIRKKLILIGWFETKS